MSAGALLFDLDGTLTDSREGIVACLRHALAQMGEPAIADAHMLQACLGPPLRDSFARLLATDNGARIDEALAHYRQRFATVGWRENGVYAGIVDALTMLAARGHQMFVCTSKPLVYAQRIVNHFGLAAHFDKVYGPGLDGNLDDKGELLKALLRTEALDPASTLMIGDRHDDVRAARANGTGAIGVLWGYGSREELAGADRLVATPAALEAAIIATRSA